MAQPVILTWVHSSGKIFEEECDLLSGDELIVLVSSFGNTTILSEQESKSVIDELGDQNLVLFEDEFGIFGLSPKKIINIRMLRA